MQLKELETKSYHDEGAELRVKDQHGKETDFYIRLVGVDSSKWREIKRKIERDAFRASIGDGQELTVADYLAEATLDWRGAEDGDKEVKFSKAKAKKLYEAAPYIADQADTFIANRQNFMPSNSQG